MEHNYIGHMVDFKEKQLQDLIKNNSLITGYVIRLDKDDNLHLELDCGYKGLVPSSKATASTSSMQERKKVLISLVGLPIKGYVESFANGYLVVNRGSYILETRQEIINKLQVGDYVYGYVRSIQPYGVFIDIGGDIVGLLHQNKIKYKLPTSFTNIGDILKVKVLSFCRETLKLEFEYDDIQDPWEHIATTYTKNEYFIGKALNPLNDSQFIRLAPGVDAMLNIKDGGFVPEGKSVRVRIAGIDYLRRKIKVELSN